MSRTDRLYGHVTLDDSAYSILITSGNTHTSPSPSNFFSLYDKEMEDGLTGATGNETTYPYSVPLHAKLATRHQKTF